MNKSLQYLLIVFGVLLLLFFVNQKQQNKYIGSEESLFKINSEIIDKIFIKDSNGDSLTLIKSDTLWSILHHDSLEVKDRQLDQFFEKVVGGTFDMMMSKNAKKWAKFGVDDSSGKKVVLFKGDNKVSAAIFSNKGDDYAHNFFRSVGEDNVYRTSENIFYMMNTRPTYWGSKPKPIVQPSDTSSVNP